MNSRVRVKPLDLQSAERFWDESPQATAFNHPRVLQLLSNQSEWWGAWRSQDLVAAWPVCQPYGAEVRHPIFSYYLGPMFNREIHGFKYHRYWAIRQQALEALVPLMIERYQHFRFSLPVGFTDIRAFEWWNHENVSGPRFKIQPRHTARIHNLQERDPEQLRQGFARNRKRDLKSIEKAPPALTSDWSDDEIIKLHDAPMYRQGREVAAQRVTALQRMIQAIQEGFGKILAFRDPTTGNLASVILLLFGRLEANNVLCVSGEPWRKQGLTAWTTWQGILEARRSGLQTFDFNGANSPLRAADKHAYNANAELYFNIVHE